MKSLIALLIAVSLLCAASAEAGLVQQNTTLSSPCNGAGCSVTLSGVVAANELILQHGDSGGTCGTVTVTGGCAGTWVNEIHPTGFGCYEQWYCSNATGGSTTATMTDASASEPALNLSEWNGLTTVDGTPASNTPGGAINPGLTGTTTTTNANDILVGGLLTRATVSSVSDSGGGTPTLLTLGNSPTSVNFLGSAYQAVSATGTYGFSFTLASTNGFVGGIVAYKTAAAGGPGSQLIGPVSLKGSTQLH